MNRLVIAVSSCVVFGCATSSPANYDVRYSTVGAANETGPLNRAAEQAFNEPLTEATQQQLSGIKVFIDSVPPELTMTDSVVSVKDGAAATLVGSVELIAKWKVPSDEDVLLAIQKAAHAASANLAFCPRSRSYARWTCYLVKTQPMVAPQTTTL